MYNCWHNNVTRSCRLCRAELKLMISRAAINRHEINTEVTTYTRLIFQLPNLIIRNSNYLQCVQAVSAFVHITIQISSRKREVRVRMRIAHLTQRSYGFNTCFLPASSRV